MRGQCGSSDERLIFDDSEDSDCWAISKNSKMAFCLVTGSLFNIFFTTTFKFGSISLSELKYAAEEGDFWLRSDEDELANFKFEELSKGFGIEIFEFRLNTSKVIICWLFRRLAALAEFEALVLPFTRGAEGLCFLFLGIFFKN